MRTIPIVLTFDGNMSLAAGVCISSILMSGNKDAYYDFIVLHSGEQPSITGLDAIMREYANMRVQYRSVGDAFKGAFEIRGITNAAYFRLLAPKLIPEYSRAIYADVDMVFRLDLESLLDRDMGDNYLGAVYALDMNVAPERLKYVKSIGATPGNYYLSGFLLMNLECMRRDDIVSRFLSFANRRFRYQDQDIMNIVCKDRIMSIPYVYSMVDGAFRIVSFNDKEMLDSKYMHSESSEDPLIYSNIHYNGAKPWKSWCPNLDQWWECYRKSPIFDPEFYFQFFYDKLDYLDQLSLLNRVKILARYFLVGRKK